MGWTETDYNESFTSKGLDKFFDEDGWCEGVVPLAQGSKVGNVYYRPLKDKHGDKVVFVALLSYSAARHTLTYKSQSDDMGPYVCTCPKRILDCVGGVSGTDNEYAKEWRKKCFAYLQKKKAISLLKPGDILRFDQVITLISGTKGRFFQYDKKRFWGKKRETVFFHLLASNPEWNHPCSLHGWKDLTFRVVTKEEMEAEFAEMSE